MANAFISHRSADNVEAELLADELRAAGHIVWIDIWKIGLGDSIVARINEGLEGSAYVVMCYSSAGVMSPWMSREWMSALARQLNGCGVKLLPVQLTGGVPPAIIADIKHANLAANWRIGITELLKAIK